MKQETNDLMPEEVLDGEMLLEFCQDLLAALTESSGSSFEASLDGLLSRVQQELGVQGIGLYRKTHEWMLVGGRGGRSLGAAPHDLFEEAIGEQRAFFAENQPALTWGRVVVPISLPDVDNSHFVVTVTGRKVTEDDVLQIEQSSRLLVSTVPLLCRQCRELLRNNAAGIFHSVSSRMHQCASHAELITLAEEALRTAFPQAELSMRPVPAEGSNDGKNQNNERILWRSESYSDEFEPGIAVVMTVKDHDADWPVPTLDESMVIRFLEEIVASSWKSVSRRKLDALLRNQKSRQSKLIGRSELMVTLRERPAQLIPTGFPLHLWGEPGVGKRTVAEFLHHEQSRTPYPLIILEAHELDEHWDQFASLWQSETSQAPAILLQNVSALSQQCQEKMLKLFQGFPAGDTGRWLMTTSVESPVELRGRVQLPESLLRLLTTSSLEIPPLRRRVEDICPLAEAFARQQCESRGMKWSGFSEEATSLLERYEWPGNVAELGLIVRRMIWRGMEGTVTAAHLLSELPLSQGEFESGEQTLAEATQEYQRAFIRSAISRAEGNMTEAARLLGLHRTNFYRKLHQLQMIEAKDETAMED